MTVLVSQPTLKTTTPLDLPPSKERKRRRLMPLSPTSHDATQRYVAPEVQIPSIPSLSKIDGQGGRLDIPLPAGSRPRQRTESFDAAFCFDPACLSPTVGQVRPRSDLTADHCIDHNSFNKRKPPFAAKESDTFAAFTKPAKGTTFGASTSFIGLEGLLPDNSSGTRNNAEEKSLRRNSSVGLDMDGTEDSRAQPEESKEGESDE